MKNPFKRSLMPTNKVELQVAADIANSLLLQRLGRKWGMVDDKGNIDDERCEAILARARSQCIEPRTPGPAGPSR